MKVYHGSTFIVKEPNLTILNNRTDFGKGFYTTTDIEQAKKWARIKKKRLDKNIFVIKSNFVSYIKSVGNIKIYRNN